MTTDAALLVIDVQNDFCPGGALAVAEGDRVVPVLNDWLDRWARAGAPVYASRDWHPVATTHFSTYGGPWPPHCVATTPGAAFHPALRLPPHAMVVSKGHESGADGYSAFEGLTSAGTSLVDDLRARSVRHLVVGGLATDYCVRATVLDALRHGFEVSVIEDAVRGVDLKPGDADRAVDEMKAAGATFVV